MKKYVILNRENVIVDILDTVRYIKLHPTNGIVVACEEDESTGLIGSDCDTHYTLIKADTTSNPNAVSVLEVDEIPSDVIVGKYIYDYEANEIVPRYTLDETRAMKQEENKAAFAEYLSSHPMTWVDGKSYGITQEDQSEISLNLSQYQIAMSAGVEAPILEWHAQHEECAPWTAEQLTALSVAITQTVYPVYHKMQKYKTQIYAAESIKEVEAIECRFEAVSD